MPPAIRAAFALDGAAFSTALGEALQALPDAEAAAVLARLREAKLIGGGGTPSDEARPQLAQFEPLLQAIAAVARGDDGPRAAIEALLPELETKGFQLTAAVHRLWAGDRDAAALVAGLDATDTQLVRRLLELTAT